MSKHFFFAMTLLGISFTFFTVVSTVQAFSTLPFGGKVISQVVPGVVCTGGTGPFVLGSNITSIGGATNGPVGAATGLYNTLPYFIPYTTMPRGVPTTSGYVLGNYIPVPNLVNCHASFFGGFSFPVKTVTLYGTSGLGR